MSTRDRSAESSGDVESAEPDPERWSDVEPTEPDPERAGENVELARRVREVCLRTFLEAYEDAGIQGLCADGRVEVAVDAVRRIDLSTVCRGGIPPKSEDVAS